MSFCLNSLRLRFIAAYLGLITLGFVALLILAGRQISAVAQTDFAARLASEVQLVAHAISDYLTTLDGDVTYQTHRVEIDAVIRSYQPRTSGTLTFTPKKHVDTAGSRPQPPPPGPGRPPPFREVRRQGDALMTAAPIFARGKPVGHIELRVPARDLDRAIVRNWTKLSLGFFVLTLIAVAASLWLSHTLMSPLEVLRQSALRLSQGDFSERITYNGIAEIKEVIAAFNDMAFQVESMLDEQRAFASNASHELRTPLTAMRLRTEALRDDGHLDDETRRQYIEDLDSEVKRLSDLVTDLTLLSRLDAGRAALGQEEIDFIRFAAQLQQQMNDQGKRYGVCVDLIPPDAPCTVYGSLTHLRVIFRNVLDNAIKYSPPGSIVQWCFDVEGSWVRHHIHDPGRGIPRDCLPHVFDRFYRGDSGRSRDVPGTGLGLALVQSIVNVYGGNVWIESPGQNQGTTVRVALPVGTPMAGLDPD